MIWCLGMYSSASTWLFNVVVMLSTALFADRWVRSRYIVVARDLPGELAPDELFVIKTHHTDDQAATELGRRVAAIIVTLRDPRDAVASLLTYHGMGFDEAMDKVAQSARECARFSADRRTLLLRYEDRFFDDPATLDAIAARIAGPVPREQREEIFAATSRPAVEAFISGMDALPTIVRHTAINDAVEMETQWHRHHAHRSGEVGRWRRELTAAQVERIETELRPWMIRFAYDT